jgi:RNA polymerase sigma-70 factor (ECF subfamily)
MILSTRSALNHPGSTSPEAEDALVLQAAAGDREAYGMLIERSWNRVVGAVYRMTGDPALAEEAAQEAFLKAWQRLEQFQPGRSFGRWAAGIAVHQAIDRLRRERPAEALDEDAWPQASLAAPAAETVFGEQERAAAVQQAVRALPAGARAVMVLREYEGLSYQEISTALAIPLGTVMSRLNYARQRLRQSLAGILEEEQ